MNDGAAHPRWAPTGWLSAWVPGPLRPPGTALVLPPPGALAPGGELEALDGSLARVRASAAAVRGTPWQVPGDEAFRAYSVTGDRSAYEAQVFGAMHRLALAALTAAGSPGQVEMAEVAAGVGAICTWRTWCWPAHEEGRDAAGVVWPDPAAPTLDLGAGEVAALLAWVDALLGPELERAAPGLRERVRREVDARIFTPFLDRSDWHWLALADAPPHNWLAWITQNLLTSALVLLPEGARRNAVVTECLANLERYLAAVPSDGAIDEGVSYWWAGAARALEALEVAGYAVEAAPSSFPAGLAELVAFPHRMQLGPGWSASFSDATPGIDPGNDGQPWHVLHRWAARLGEEDARRYASAARAMPLLDEAFPPSGGLGRMLGALSDPAWRATRPEAAPLPRRVWLASTQVLLARPAAGSARGVTLVAKGGHNGEAHNHLDVGSVTVALDGVPVVIDLGRASYRAGTFGPQRYAEWHISSVWHNVPAPGGPGQGVGREFHALAELAADDGGAHLAIDLTGVYPGFAGSWRRTAVLEEPGRVRVADAWRGVDGASRIGWVIAGEVTLEAGCAVVIPIDGERRLAIRWESLAGAPVQARLVTRPLEDPYLREAWGERVHRLDLFVDAPGGEVVTTFEPA